jgi:predicted ribosome quality control (RQC) complex YloA/Tae2 family protein
LDEARKNYEELKSKADLLSSNISEISNILKNKKLEFQNIRLNLQLNARQNASEYYEKAKEFKQKIPAIEKILRETEQKFMHLEKAISKEQLALNLEPRAKRQEPTAPKKWYQKFHWFYTSGGFLAVGGRDATQNDILIKKYLGKDDIVFHTEWPGSPFFILRDIRKLKSLPEADLREVAVATAAYSRAWKSGIGSTDLYWVLPEQVSKQAKPGEYLGKGAFMIYGKKNMMRSIVLEIAIGIDKDGQILAGPRSAVSKYCKAYSIVRPGREKKSDLAKKIAKRLGTDQIDAIVSGLPAGEGIIVKSSL